MPKFDLEYAVDTIQFFRVTVEAETLREAVEEGYEVARSGPRNLVDSDELDVTWVPR